MLVGTVLRSDALAGRILENAALRWIGRISYSLYLWQQLFLVGRDAPLIPQLGAWQAWPLNLAAVLACAVASYYLIERPTIKIGYRLTGQRPPKHVQWSPSNPYPQISTTD
jgi:peptidoglycan/LPS O-acetylase OafA/YrhL